jgi:hypothetical protein
VRRVPPQEPVHQQPDGTLVEPRPRRGVPRKAQTLPPHRALPQGPEEAGGVGGAFVRGSQGVARFRTLQAKGAREGERRGAHERLWAEPQAARGLRSQRGPKKMAMVAALRPPEKPSLHPIRRHRTIPAWRFSTRWGILRSPHPASCIVPILRRRREVITTRKRVVCLTTCRGAALRCREANSPHPD